MSGVLARFAKALRRTERGQSVIEFAIVLPVLLIIAFGAVDVGRVFFDFIKLRGAAMAGANYGARFPTDESDIKLNVLEHGVPDGVHGSDVDVSFSPAGHHCEELDGPTDCTVVVSVRHTFWPISSIFFEPVGLDEIEVIADASMRVLK